MIKKTIIYDFENSKYQAPIYNKNLVFECEKFSVNVIDQLQGKIPVVINRDFLSGKKNNLSVLHTHILDSHIVHYIDVFVRGKISGIAFNVMADYLSHVVQINCELDSNFYLMENYTKSTLEQFIKTSSQKMESIYRIHTMDEELFLKVGKIKEDKAKVKGYLDRYSVKNLEQLAKRVVERFKDFEYCIIGQELSLPSYACLLKMVLLHHFDKSKSEENLVKKYSDFLKFMTTDVGVVLPHELNTSVYYFSGVADRFINVQPNMSFEKAKKRLLATAWDLILMKFPSFLYISPTELPLLNMPYIVTSEKQLQDFSRLFQLSYLYFNNEDSAPKVLLKVDDKYESCNLTKNVVKKVTESQKDLVETRLGYKPSSSTLQNIKLLIEELETQLSFLCN